MNLVNRLKRAKALAKGAQVRARQAMGLGRLPNLLVLGVQRGGSTSLHSYLSQHPDIVPAIRQEVHYFDLHYHRGLGWYRAQFYDRPGAQVAFDNSPYYIFHPAVPGRVAHDLKDVKFIVTLRNPVDRAASQYWLSIAQRHETLPFAEAIEKENERLGNAEELLRTGAIRAHTAHRANSYLSRGLYAQQLRNWFQFHPRENFLVLQSEAMFADPRAAMERVFGFLGLRPAPLNARALNKGKTEKMDPALRAKLEQYYAAPNRELEALLGQKFVW